MANDPQSLSKNRATGRGPVTGAEGPQGYSQETAIGGIEEVSEENLGSAARSKKLMEKVSSATRSTGYVSASFAEKNNPVDWRVKLSLPNTKVFNIPNLVPDGSGQPPEGLFHLMRPLKNTRGLVFPYTPNIYITYSANYDNLAPTHSNYPFPIYQNSAVDQFVITGEFTAENSAEAAYWIAANQYLRTVTKMNYGTDTNRGAPPPVVKLNGYGDFVFHDVPVVVQQYTVELGDAVDYIEADVGNNGSWAPTRSTISVTLQPAFSRDSVNSFDLKEFAQGGYLNTPPGFI